MCIRSCRVFIWSLQFLLIIRLFAKSCFIYGEFSLYLFFLSSYRLLFVLAPPIGLPTGHFFSVHLAMLVYSSFIHYPLLSFSNTHSQFNYNNCCFWHIWFRTTNWSLVYGMSFIVFFSFSHFYTCDCSIARWVSIPNDVMCTLYIHIYLNSGEKETCELLSVTLFMLWRNAFAYRPNLHYGYCHWRAHVIKGHAVTFFPLLLFWCYRGTFV